MTGKLLSSTLRINYLVWLGITEHFLVHAGLILVGSHNYMT